jgi:hypothetical protein
MRKHREWLTLLLAAVCVATAGATQAMAQAYPSRPIAVIVPAAAGGPTGALARMIAESMGRTLNAQFVVEKWAAPPAPSPWRASPRPSPMDTRCQSGISRRRPPRRSTITSATT